MEEKKCWFGLVCLFSLSALGTALAPDPYTFSFFRFIGGLGIGVSSVAAPTYISEISTPANRGKLRSTVSIQYCIRNFGGFSFQLFFKRSRWRKRLAMDVGCFSSAFTYLFCYGYRCSRKSPLVNYNEKMIKTHQKKY